MEIYVKKHGRGLVSLCDRDIVGKTLHEGDLEVEISEHFYKNDDVEDMSEEEALEILKDATNINIFGEKAVAFAIRHGIIDEENVITIQGVPHAQMISI